jgi:ribosomal protein S18 acetylase RimI-like enzyme
VNVRRLGPGDEAVVERLARDAAQTALLADERTIFVVAFDNAGGPMGFALAYELPRRHGNAAQLFLYEVDVAPACRRQGVATRLLLELSRVAEARGIREGFVLTNASNAGAMQLYESAGGKRPFADDVLWDFEFPLDFKT